MKKDKKNQSCEAQLKGAKRIGGFTAEELEQVERGEVTAQALFKRKAAERARADLNNSDRGSAAR